MTFEPLDGCLFINRPKCLGFLKLEMHYKRVYITIDFSVHCNLRDNGHLCFSPNVLSPLLQGFVVFLMAQINE